MPTGSLGGPLRQEGAAASRRRTAEGLRIIAFQSPQANFRWELIDYATLAVIGLNR